MTSPSPTPPPAVDQVREAAVEAVARGLWLAMYEAMQLGWDKAGPTNQAIYRERAAALLALPAVSALLAEARADGELRAAVRRKLVECFDASHKPHLSEFDRGVAAAYADVADQLHRALAATHPESAAIRQTEGNNR